MFLIRCNLNESILFDTVPNTETCHVVKHIGVGRIIVRVGVALNVSVEDGWMLHLFLEKFLSHRFFRRRRRRAPNSTYM